MILLSPILKEFIYTISNDFEIEGLDDTICQFNNQSINLKIDTAVTRVQVFLDGERVFSQNYNQFNRPATVNIPFSAQNSGLQTFEIRLNDRFGCSTNKQFSVFVREGPDLAIEIQGERGGCDSATVYVKKTKEN